MEDVKTVATTIGVDIGQRQDPSAVVVCEALTGDRHRIHHIERLALQTAYPQVAERLAHVYRMTVARVLAQQERSDRPQGHLTQLSRASYMDPPGEAERRAAESVWVLVDATGCGLPVVDFLRERSGIEAGHLCGVTFTAGSGCTVRRGAREGRVSKSYLVSRMKSLMGFGRLQWPRSAAARELADELENFELSISDNATPQWNARAGHHDDLVCAAALAVLLGGAGYESGSIRYA